MCMSCLSSLGKASMMYSMDHDGAYPSAWSDLAGEYVTTPRIFDCKSNGRFTGTMEQVDFLSDFRIVSGLTTNSPPDAVFAYEPLDNHNSRGGNVLFVNGAVEWMKPDQHAQALNTINKEHQHQRRR